MQRSCAHKPRPACLSFGGVLHGDVVAKQRDLVSWFLALNMAVGTVFAFLCSAVWLAGQRIAEAADPENSRRSLSSGGISAGQGMFRRWL